MEQNRNDLLHLNCQPHPPLNQSGNEKHKLRICVLQPDYATSVVNYQYYDPKRDLCHLMPEADIDHVNLNKLTTYKQLKKLKKKKYDVFINLCEGYLDWEIPSIDVIYSLELLNLPYTGPNTLLYDPSKELMKYVAYTVGINTPPYALVTNEENLTQQIAHLKYPLFVKPEKAGDSLGINKKSLVFNVGQLLSRFHEINEEYGPLLIEEYIDGREFTVLIAANGDGTATTFKPVEYIFLAGDSFKTYELKTAKLHPGANIAVTDIEIETQLREAAQRIFKSFNGIGYARLDFRMNNTGTLFFLEINFTCSVFYKDGFEGSADYILKHDGFGQADFLRHIVAEGIARYKSLQKKYTVRGNSISGYGIYSTQNIDTGEVVFQGEELSQRIVTRSYVEKNWSAKDRDVFQKYAYPLSKEVFLLWDNNPSCWAPQNHSCNPNTFYKGLNVLANKQIFAGEELTLDYTAFLDENMKAFMCCCGSINCRSYISGKPKNSVTHQESLTQPKNNISTL